MQDSTNTNLDNQELGDPATEWRPGQNQAAAEAEKQQQALARAWQQHADEERARSPELQDAQSGLSRAVQEILREIPELSQGAHGFQHAAAMARARLQALELPALQSRLEALTKENERLARLTSIPGSPPARTGRDEEPALTERDLRRLAHDLDFQGAL